MRRLNLMLVGFLFLVLSPQHSVAQLPEDLFEPPSGPYATGTVEYLWIDSARGENYTSDPADLRHVLVRIWYPASVFEGAETAPWFFDAEEFSPDEPGLTAARQVKTHSVLNAPMVAGDERFPVLVYNHGGSWTRFSGTFVTEWLASYGYVVMSVGHVGFNKTVRFPDGFEFEQDTLLPPGDTGDLEHDAFAFWDYLDEFVVPVWADDAEFALDRLAQPDGELAALLSARLDFERVGMMGWSLGGALSLEMSRRDPRVRAAVDMDGQLFGDVVDVGTTRPVMIMHGGVSPVGEDSAQTAIISRLLAFVDEQTAGMLAKVTNDSYEITIAGAEHGHFSDLVLGSPDREDRIAARRGHEIIKAYTLAFFDRYLRGRASVLLTSQSAEYPEVTFRKR